MSERIKLFDALKEAVNETKQVSCPAQKPPPETLPKGGFTREVPREMRRLVSLLIERRDNSEYGNAQAGQRAKYVFADFGHILVCEHFEVPIDSDVELHEGWIVSVVPPADHTGTPL